MKNLKNKQKIRASIFMNEIKHSSTNLSAGKLRLLQLSKMQKYANSKRLRSAT